jgi:hypothetical protein
MAKRAGLRRALGLAVLATASAVASGCSPLLYAAMALRGNGPSRSLAVGRVATGSTDHGDGRLRPSCAGRRGGALGEDTDTDNVWTFAPGEDGWYEFRADAAYDTVLAVLRDRGEGEELGCNDDDGDGTNSRLRLRLARGVRYLVVVDGYRGDHGEYALRADRVEGP